MRAVGAVIFAALREMAACYTGEQVPRGSDTERRMREARGMLNLEKDAAAKESVSDAWRPTQ
ncbi:hypothetical protein TSA66_08955 [Noviherbaspirillum autotrophicum]|uniref:Uncharacterized protein n=1 Tax=Noviherbaspirillum autotrophicum TaxID=709839 RepID=A0A0C2BS87_9BURK|nr:hypothetical protein TSA66_08955 [Noviherbaspirillum autotrophicum]